MDQMRSTMETMRSVCGPKSKASDELIDGSRRFTATVSEGCFISSLFLVCRIEAGEVCGRPELEVLHSVRSADDWHFEQEERIEPAKGYEPN